MDVEVTDADRAVADWVLSEDGECRYCPELNDDGDCGDKRQECVEVMTRVVARAMQPERERAARMEKALEVLQGKWGACPNCKVAKEIKAKVKAILESTD